MKSPIVIVGGGLSGLYAARLLAAAGTGFLLIEARERLGGRILSVGADGKPAAGPAAFDLGPSWFWPDMQPMMAGLVGELGLAAFPQQTDGDVVVERSPREPVQRFGGYGEMASSFRIAGGTAALIAALAAGLPKAWVRLNLHVTQARLQDDGIELKARGADGEVLSIAAGRVLFALPPRLLESSVAFTPPLAPEIRARWRATPTWMAPHAKFLAVYEKAFWRDKGLSGTAQSLVGPCTEIHDASALAGGAALFGFLGLPAAARQKLGEAALKGHCVEQLVRLFGPDAAHPVATFLKDWAADPLTATADDQGAAGHPEATGLPRFDSVWAARAAMAGSETASGHPGYLEGALEAAAHAAAPLVQAGAAEEAMVSSAGAFGEGRS